MRNSYNGSNLSSSLRSNGGSSRQIYNNAPSSVDSPYDSQDGSFTPTRSGPRRVSSLPDIRSPSSSSINDSFFNTTNTTTTKRPSTQSHTQGRSSSEISLSQQNEDLVHTLSQRSLT